MEKLFAINIKCFDPVYVFSSRNSKYILIPLVTVITAVSTCVSLAACKCVYFPLWFVFGGR